MPVLTRSQALGLAGRFAAAAAGAADADTAGTLLDLTADLVNHANGHPVPWLAAGQPVVGTARRWAEMTPAENTTARERLARNAIARARRDGLPMVAAAQEKVLARLLAS